MARGGATTGDKWRRRTTRGGRQKGEEEEAVLTVPAQTARRRREGGRRRGTATACSSERRLGGASATLGEDRGTAEARQGLGKGVSSAIREDGEVAELALSAAKPVMAVAQPEVDGDGGSRRPEATKRRRPRVDSGGGVSVRGWGNGVAAGLALETVKPVEVVSWCADD
ncbi:hypothetical protein [Oryza sativa Japonica Group]|uniref:DUF834 domain-containing protein n=1 Tax=Oryza sativa subsp. japonica TaxID=39947 RepID=Q5N9A8_ORYSJ|nr:hypothetical protein [Oryza sativa Japonica Group]